MVLFVDALTAIATVGTSIQSFFAWTGYNRDNFALGIGWRQAHQYQTKNYHSSWVSFAREDLLELKGASMHHIGNYMMVASMALSSTVLAFVVAGFNSECPAFVVCAFYTSAASATVLLTLAIMFGVKAQGSAYEHTVHSLVTKLRPYHPMENFNYLKQVQHIEKQGLGSLLRRPGQEEDYGLDETSYVKTQCNEGKNGDTLLEGVSKEEYLRELSSALSKDELTTNAANGLAHDVAEDDTMDVEVINNSQDAPYLETFFELLLLWRPHEDYCKVCMGLGTLSWTEAALSFCVGKILGTSFVLKECLVIILAVPFLFIMVTVFYAYGSGFPTLLPATLALSNVLFTLAASITCPVTLAVLVPLAFAMHMGFWILVGVAVYCQTACEEAARQSKAEAEMPVPGENPPPGFAVGSTHEFLSAEYLQSIQQRSQRKLVQGRRVVYQGLFICLFMWLCMTAWAIAVHVVIPLLPTTDAELVMPTADIDEVEVVWPSLFYSPHALACAGGQAFTADRYSVFEMHSQTGGLIARKRICEGLPGTIKAIAATCDSSGCHPLVLVQGSTGSAISNCTHTEPLEGDDRIAEHLSVRQEMDGQSYSNVKLLTIHQGELVQYYHKPQAQEWRAEWVMSRTGNTTRSISSTMNDLLLMHDAEGSHPVIEVVSLVGSWATKRWNLPKSASSAIDMCALSQSSALLLLADKGRPRLARAKLSQ
eukprot:TRINITY_DN90748_c0_g1_i1.p1 TRINITY_DN90748_c0_g1~~TRINITY_DN90748_c0_g1_i1.p1  ORF type:complete len:709 (-),score=102.48 TRINITY_DN90748_c0_g1_i1:46-2172(-)